MGISVKVFLEKTRLEGFSLNECANPLTDSESGGYEEMEVWMAIVYLEEQVTRSVSSVSYFPVSAPL